MSTISNSIVSAWTALCLQCAPQIHPATTVAIIKTESGGNPYAINDNTAKHSYAPKTKDQAVNLARSLLSRGHSIDMGLMQVNSTHLRTMGINYWELLDPCTNINVGGRILMGFYKQNARAGQSSQVTLMKALSAYNTGSPYRGYYNGYVNKILRNTNPAFFFYKPADQIMPQQETQTAENDQQVQAPETMSFANTGTMSYSR